MLPDFNRLRVFHTIYAEKSVTKAAKRLHLSQSAVSQHLSKLEGEIQAPLFVRLHRKLVPTTAAENLFAIVSPFVEELSKGMKTLRRRRQIPSGELRIGAPTEFGKKYFPPLFASFRKAWPEVTFFLRLGNPVYLLSLVGSGRLDFAFVDIFPAKGGFIGKLSPYSIEPLIAEEVILACSAAYYQERIHGDHGFGHLGKQDFIAYRTHAVTIRNWFFHHFSKAPAQVQVVMTVDSHQAVIAAIKSHMGLGVVASHLVYDDIQNGDVFPITTPAKHVVNRISLVQLADKIPTLTEKTFLEYFQNQIQSAGILQHFRTLADAPDSSTNQDQ